MNVFTVRIQYGDGPPVEQPETFADRAPALRTALDLADTLGRAVSAGARGWPRWVSICVDGRLDISIQVVRGGLAGRAPQDQADP